MAFLTPGKKLADHLANEMTKGSSVDWNVAFMESRGFQNVKGYAYEDLYSYESEDSDDLFKSFRLWEEVFTTARIPHDNLLQSMQELANSRPYVETDKRVYNATQLKRWISQQDQSLAALWRHPVSEKKNSKTVVVASVNAYDRVVEAEKLMMREVGFFFSGLMLGVTVILIYTRKTSKSRRPHALETRREKEEEPGARYRQR